MWEFLDQYKEEIAGFIVSVGGLFALVWAKITSMRTEKAKRGADVAIAESQKEVYEQMRERMTAQEQRLERHEVEIDQLRSDIRSRDTKIHMLELYVQDLQHVLHLHGIDIPVMRTQIVPPPA